MPVVPPELGVGSLERGVTVGLGLLDTVSVVLLGLVVLGRVLGFGHGDGCGCRLVLTYDAPNSQV